MRQECASPGELVDLFLELTAGCKVPAGSIVLMASLTHLADVGLSAYAEDVSKAAAKLYRVFQGGVFALPGLLFPPETIQDPVLSRAIIDALTWSKTVAKIVPNGGQIMDSCIGELVQYLLESGTGSAQAPSGVRCRLPRTLGMQHATKWDTSGLTGLKNCVGPLEPTCIIKVLDTLFSELNGAVGTDNIKVVGLYGITERNKLGKKIVIVGASHGRRLADLLADTGEETVYVEAPSFRLLNKDVVKLAEDIADALGESNSEEAIILLNLVDNSFFVARCEDGHYIPPHKDNLGHYHIDGEITCAPADTAKQLMINLFPILKKFDEFIKILLVPLPRYLYSACCGDPEHAPNVLAADHVETMMTSLDTTHKMWRGIAFREKIKKLKICNAGRLLADRDQWGDDPVHPLPGGYQKVAKFVTVGFETLMGGVEAGGSGQGGRKRSREDGDTAPYNIPKRPGWVSKSENFATRYDVGGWRDSRGGGGGGGRGGRGGRGGGGGNRGWWRGGGRGGLYY
jgi:hypothetical protein